MFAVTILLSLLLAGSLIAWRRREAQARSDHSKTMVARPQPKVVPVASEARAATFPLAALLPAMEFSQPVLPDLGARLRDRYIAARFPGMFGGTAELADPERVVKVARLYFDEGKTDRAQELLGIASRRSPLEATLRLAQLEIAFVTRDAGAYVARARDFQAALPNRPEWEEIARLGHALAPAEPLFAAATSVRVQDHYGPWPDTPNWIQASWDLTTEVLAADFHAAVRAQSQGVPA